MNWIHNGRQHILHGRTSTLVIEHKEGNEYDWVFAIWVPVRGEDHLLTTGTHKGTEEGAKHAVAEALRIAAVNLTHDAQAAAVLPARAAFNGIN